MPKSLPQPRSEGDPLAIEPGLCGAKSRSGAPCKKRIVPGRTRCKYHGGKTPRGAASPHYKDGSRSRFVMRLPPRYQAAFNAAMSDADKLSALTDQIAIVDVREAELLGRLSPEGNTAKWHEAAGALEEMDAARHMPDGPRKAAALGAAFGALQDAIRSGVTEEQIWRDFYENVEVRRRLVDTERRRIEGLKAYLTIEQAVALMGRIVGLVKEAGVERKQIAYIVDGIQVLLDPGLPNPMSSNDFENLKIDSGEEPK